VLDLGELSLEGKDPARLPRWIEPGVAYADNLDAAIASRLQYWAGTYVPAMFSQRLYTPRR
jgi:coenzyme F420-dependent glucose-6-phosphate dehydrogenase